MEPKTKQYLLVTVVGVTLFVALLRLKLRLIVTVHLPSLCFSPTDFCRLQAAYIEKSYIH